jgi:glycosyltransferase involved in cell wall biosynthesis
MKNWIVITPTYNAEKYINFVIDNVSNQTASPDHFVIDSCSTDATASLVENESSNKCVSLLQKNDTGIYDGMNNAIDLNIDKYKFVALLNSDDFYVDDALLDKVEICFEKFNADIVSVDVGYVADYGLPLERKTNYGDTLVNKVFFNEGGQLAHPGIFVRSSFYHRLKYDNNLDISADYKFQLQACMKYNAIIKTLPVHGVNQRNGGHSQSGVSAFVRGKFQIFKALNEFFNPFRSCLIVIKNVKLKLNSRL